jgi:hypothetical protein
MPNDQCQLGHLLALFAQLHQSGLTTVRVQQLGHPDQHLPVFLTNAIEISRTSGMRIWRSGSGESAARGACICGHAVIVLVLCDGGGRSGLGLSMGERGRMLLCLLLSRLLLLLLLLLEMGLVLWLMVVLLLLLCRRLVLLLHPGRLGLRVLVLVREDVLALCLKHGERRASGGFI